MLQMSACILRLLLFTAPVAVLTFVNTGLDQAGNAGQSRYAVLCVAFSPNSKSLAYGGGWDGRSAPAPRRGGDGFLKIRDSQSLKEICSFDKHFTNCVVSAYFRDDDAVFTHSD